MKSHEYETPKQSLETDSKARCGVLYPPLRGIVQLTNSAALRPACAGLRFRNWSFTNKIILIIIALILLAAPAVDAKNIIKIGKDINIGENQKINSAIAIGGQITVSGLVENNVITLGGSIVLTGAAVVRGNVVCIGGVVAQGNGAQIYGNITEVLFTLALLMAFLFPRPLNAIVSSIQENKAKSFFWGFLGTMMIAPFFMLLILSFVGIPLIPLAFSFILLAFMFGFISVSALLGKYVLTKVFRHHKQSLVRETLLGLVLWWIIGWTPFYVGMVVKTVVITIGFGGVLLVVFYRGYNRRTPPVAEKHI
jgi:hypothetical protein